MQLMVNIVVALLFLPIMSLQQVTVLACEIYQKVAKENLPSLNFLPKP
jgi:hypothetical protein